MQASIDGIRIGYDDRGAGPAIVLVHGFTLDRSSWEEQVPHLAERARVITVDLRGSGESSRGEGPALMETMAGDIFGLLEHLGIERATIAGHSMGGWVTLAFFRMYAERVAGLALVASSFTADPPEGAAGRSGIAHTTQTEGMATIVGMLGPALFAEPFAAAHPDVIAHVRELAMRTDPGAAAAHLLGMGARVDATDLIEDLQLPVTIVAGDADALLPQQATIAAAAALPDCEIVRLPGVGHMPMYEAPEQTTAALARLIERASVRV